MNPYKMTCAALVAGSMVSPGLANWQFRSRPDLAPPRLNITFSDSLVLEPGYLFLAPFAGLPKSVQPGPRQAAPYIFRSDGDLVWSGYGYYSIWATNFHAGKWKGQNVLYSFEGDHNPGYGHGHGHVTVLDEHYETIREVRAGGHRLMDKHEWREIDGKTALIQVYQPVPRNLTEWGGSPEQQWIVDAIFQELDITTGNVLFEWSSLDHVSPSEAILPLNPGQAGSGYNSSDAWDYFHINSVDKDAAGNYLISARDACSIHKVNGTSGDIIWRLNGKASDFKLGKGVDFCFQHQARWVLHTQYPADDGEEIISFYDNSAHGSEDGSGNEVHTAPMSSGKIVKLDTKSWQATLVQGFYPPDKLLSKSQGSTQILPNGNVLVGWGSEGAFTEFLPNGTAVFHAYADSGSLGVAVENYRAYKSNWTGSPHEDPAIAAFRIKEGGSNIYVSWNGDTETVKWSFSDIPSNGSESIFLGEAKRTSFETKFHVPGRHVDRVQATAIGKHGASLAVTAIVKSEDEVLPLSHRRMHGNQQQELLQRVNLDL